MTLRKLHRHVAIIMAPFMLLLGLTGVLLLFRKTQWYEKDVKHLLVDVHTWEWLAPFIGSIFGLGLIFLSISGIILFFNRRA